MIHAAIFASGSGSNAENLIRYFSGKPQVKIKLVVTNNEKAGIVRRAELLKKNVHLISKNTLSNYSDQFIAFLKSEKVDLIILAGFLLKIPESMIMAFPGRIINIHPSLLPKYGGKGMYGENVHRAVIEAKETESGITVHYVNEAYDEGEIILQAHCPVNNTDTPNSLAIKIHDLEYRYFPMAVEKVIQKLESEKNTVNNS
jgi:phosphoribosylglycinamide formyltransferase-1